jgi:hypothetical protein
LRFELELVGLHIHPPTPEAHTFRFQPQPLFDGVISAQFDLAACSEDALPRQAKRPVQHSRDLARATRNSGRTRDGAVGRDFPLGDFLDSRTDTGLRRRLR